MTQKNNSLSNPVSYSDGPVAGVSAGRFGKGFTLIELMVVLAIVAILGTLAAPSMGRLIEQNRVAAEINSFVGDVQWARGEAVKRGLPVVICESSSGTSCATANKWELGWLAFVDLNGNGALDTGEPVLKVRSAWKGSDTFKIVTPTSSPPNLLSFSRDGFAVQTVSLVQYELKAPGGGSARCLHMAAAGRLQTTAGTCA